MRKNKFLLGLCILLPIAGIAASIAVPFLLHATDEFEDKWLEYKDFKEYLEAKTLTNKIGTTDDDWRHEDGGQTNPDAVALANSVSQQCFNNGIVYSYQQYCESLLNDYADTQVKWKIHKNTITLITSSEEAEVNNESVISTTKNKNGTFNNKREIYFDDEQIYDIDDKACEFHLIDAEYDNDIQKIIEGEYKNANNDNYAIKFYPEDFNALFHGNGLT